MALESLPYALNTRAPFVVVRLGNLPELLVFANGGRHEPNVGRGTSRVPKFGGSSRRVGHEDDVVFLVPEKVVAADGGEKIVRQRSCENVKRSKKK